MILERRFFPEGKLIIEEGEFGNIAFLIQSGSVAVFSEDSGRRVDLAVFEAGQIFGELALVHDGPRTASVEAAEDCNLIVITRDTLEDKLSRSDRTVRAIVEMLTQRITTTSHSLVRRDDDINDFIEHLRKVYQDILIGLPRGDQAGFQDTVLPKLDALFESLEPYMKTS